MPEGPLGKPAVNAEPGAQPLCSCRIDNSADRMTSRAADCEGQRTCGLLGYVLAGPPADAATTAIYRCDTGGHHFESLDAACEGRTVEFRLGWVLT